MFLETPNITTMKFCGKQLIIMDETWYNNNQNEAVLQHKRKMLGEGRHCNTDYIIRDIAYTVRFVSSC